MMHAQSAGVVPFRVTAAHPTERACVITVEGELDALTTPDLRTSVRDQLAARPEHLILELPRLSFLGCTGLGCLLETRALTQQTHTGLHLAGPLTRVVARLLDVTGLRGSFDTYPTLADALDALVAPSTPEARRARPAEPQTIAS